MPPRRALTSAFDVRPGERRLVGLLFAHSFFLGVPRVLTGTVAMALFLARFEASDLPFVYLGAAAAVPLTGFVRLKLAGRLSLPRLFALDLAVVFAVLILLRLALLGPQARWVGFMLPIWYEVEWVLLSLESGGLAGGLLDVRQGKRLFGLVGSGELAAGGLAGLAVPLLVESVGTPNLLLFSAGAVAVSFALLLVLARACDMTATVRGDPRTESRTRFSDLLRSRYLALVFLLVALSYLGYYVLDNAFYALCRSEMPREAQLASFLGVFWAIASLATFLSRGLLSGRVLTRYGVLPGLLALPAAVASGVALTVLSGAMAAAATLVFTLMALTRLIDQVLRDSVDRSALLVLYQPLPTRQRLRAQTAVEGIVGPIAGGAAGLGLLVLVKVLHLQPIPLVSLVLVLVVAWMAVAFRARRGYSQVLERALAGRRLAASPLLLDEPATRQILEQGISSAHPQEVAYCLDMLEASRHPSLESLLVGLTAHPSEDVRANTLLRIERLGIADALPAVRALAEAETAPAVRGAALRALAILGEDEDLERVAELLDDGADETRKGALIGMLRSGSIESILTAGQRLAGLAAAGEPRERILAAQVIGEVGERNFYRPLLRLLCDADLEVRHAALAAAGRLGSPRLWPLALEALPQRRLRPTAMAALAAGGEAVLPLVDTALRHAQALSDRAQSQRLVRLCAQIPGTPALECLWRWHDSADAGIRHAVLGSLSLRGFVAGRDRNQRVEDGLAREAALAARMLAAAEDLGSLPSTALLQRALDHALDEARERMLCLLSFAHPRDAVWRARINLRSAHRAQRAQAVELIDSLISPDLRLLCLPLIDDLPRAERLRLLARRFPQERLSGEERLRRIIAGDENVSDWVRACATRAAADGGLIDIGGAVRGALATGGTLVRETAAWILGRAVAVAGVDVLQGLPEQGRALAERFALGAASLPSVRPEGEGAMLSTIEKVIILKGVSVFAETPDEVLAEVAGLLDEVELDTGETIFEKGDMGAALFIVVEGRVRVHAEGRTLRELGERDIFGEMAALDPEPRSASVTAVAPTRLFRLEQEALYELMADRIEVVRGVIRVLCRRLRGAPAPA